MIAALAPLLVDPIVVPRDNPTPGGSPMWAEVGTNPFNLIIFAAAVLAGLAVLVGGIRAAVRFLRRIGHLIDDLQGQPARPGIPAQPGVMVRLQQLEEHTRQLKPNGGSHLADKIAVIETRGAAIEQRVNAIGEQLRDRGQRLEQLEELRRDKQVEHAAFELRLAVLEGNLGSANDSPAPASLPGRRSRRNSE